VARPTDTIVLCAVSIGIAVAQQPSMLELPFRNRRAAGQVLASRLMKYAGRPDVIVLALPRGGVPVAFEVARTLDAPLDVFLVRKLGVPGHEELAMGAIASGGVRVLNRDIIDMLGLTDVDVDEVAARETDEIDRRERLYRGAAPPPDLDGRVVILVDDGLATGASMRAAVAALRAARPARIVVAVPVGARATCEELQSEVDEVVCTATPEPFDAVGLWYREFLPTSDEEVRKLLNERRQEHTPAHEGRAT
jgi:putative phosphoribosyl transferase